MKRLAIVLSHPIQYYSPLFKFLAKSIHLKVFYAFNPNADEQGEQGFQKSFKWDINLLDGYDYEFLNNVSEYPGTSRYKGCDTPAISSQLDVYKPTHILIFGWHLKTYHQALAYAKRNKIKVGVRGDSQANPSQSIIKKLIKAIYYPFFLNKFDYFFSVGSRNKQYLKSFGIQDERVLFSPHAVDQAFWENKSSFDKGNKSEIVFLWVAKFIDKKRPLDAINAYLKFKQKYDGKVSLRMVGSGPLLKASKRIASSEPSIQFLGFKNQKELRAEYWSSSCLILSSDYGETWGLVVNEAFSSLQPAIVSSAVGCSEDLINQNTGAIYKFGSIEDLSEKLNEMSSRLLNPKKLQAIEEAIKEKNVKYSFERNLKAFNRFLQL